MGARGSWRRLRRPSRQQAGAAVLIAGVLTLAAFAGLQAGLFQGFRLEATDALFPAHGADRRVVVVGIDQSSIARVNRQWPWPRAVQADLLRRIHTAGARVIAVDLVYNPATDEDAELAEAVRAGNVVLAAAPQLRRHPGDPLLTAQTGTAPVPALADAAAAIGHTGITADPADGVVRSLPLAVFDARGEPVPSLSLAAVAVLEHAQGPLTVRRRGVQVGDRFVPTDRLASLDIDFASGLLSADPGPTYVSAADVLAGHVGGARLRGKVVLVGLVDPTLGDQHLTPPVKAGGMPGVLVQANAVNTMLTRAYLHPVSRTETLAWAFMLAGLVAVGAGMARFWVSGVITLVAVVGYVAMAFARFDHGQVLDLVYPLLVVLLAFVATLGARYFSEAARRRAMTAVLTQYVPAGVARHLLDRRRRTDLPTGTITFLFTDVVGSTAAWERHPREMGEAMRLHDGLIEKAVEANHGALVRPRGEGDSRFAVFIDAPDAAAAAVAIDRYFEREHWPTPEPVQVRTAIHTGDAELREGDYYGSPVNRCARIRSLAGPGQIFLSEASAQLVADALPAGARLDDLGQKALKDMAEPERVYELTWARRPAVR